MVYLIVAGGVTVVVVVYLLTIDGVAVVTSGMSVVTGGVIVVTGGVVVVTGGVTVVVDGVLTSDRWYDSSGMWCAY